MDEVLIDNMEAEARRLIAQIEKHGSTDCAEARAVLNADLPLQIAALEVCLEMQQSGWDTLPHLMYELLSRDLPITPKYLEWMLDHAICPVFEHRHFAQWPAILNQVQNHIARGGQFTEPMLDSLHALYETVGDTDNVVLFLDVKVPPEIAQKVKAQIELLVGNRQANRFPASENWIKAMQADTAALPPRSRAAWEALFRHAESADASKPSPKWLKQAQKLISAVEESLFVVFIAEWFGNVEVPPRIMVAGAMDTLTAALRYGVFGKMRENSIVRLKGLAWCCVGRNEPALARALGHLADAAFRKVPGAGPWASRAGNAAIYALGQMTCAPEAVGQLSLLRAKMRDRSALKAIGAAVEQVAARSGMAADDLEDLAVPTGGLDADGTRRMEFGADGSALLTLHPHTGHVTLQWFGPDGKERKAIPAAVKKNHADDVKALKAAAEEVAQTLSAQSARLDRALLEERAWPRADWEARFLAHPVLGNLARRLVWATPRCIALPQGGELGEEAVKLWHPITSTPAEVMGWRDRLADAGIVQPFKQAHREVYLLTDAERNTRTYSNRFAAHVIKQHQFNSLCALRGWKNKLRLMVDDSYPPATRDLPQHNLRAEFWVEGIGDDYGTDTNDAGTYLRLSTDQVRFYRADAPVVHAHAGGGGYSVWGGQATVEPLPLEEVPPLVLSEILRDVDLFVGVASVGNDPTWADGGPAGRFRTYWQDYAFGDLGETAKTRRAVLERLLPRLKIASRTELTDKFLRVRGDLRTYKVHLGSGNILMEPHDQYLCIVPNSRENGAGDVFLPFEGDRTLAIILSKAFLLADDTKITDPTITRQLR